jgi:hypothetical protein
LAHQFDPRLAGLRALSVADFSFDRKSPAPMVGRRVLLSALHLPIECGLALA